MSDDQNNTPDDLRDDPLISHPLTLEDYLPEKCQFYIKHRESQQIESYDGHVHTFQPTGYEIIITIVDSPTVQQIIDKLHGIANGLERDIRSDLSGAEPSLGGDRRENGESE